MPKNYTQSYNKSITFALGQAHRTICGLTQATFIHKPHPRRTLLPAQTLHARAADGTGAGGGRRAWSLHGWEHKLTEQNVKAHSIALWHRSLIPILFAPFYSINNLENITQVVRIWEEICIHIEQVNKSGVEGEGRRSGRRWKDGGRESWILTSSLSTPMTLHHPTCLQKMFR